MPTPIVGDDARERVRLECFGEAPAPGRQLPEGVHLLQRVVRGDRILPRRIAPELFPWLVARGITAGPDCTGQLLELIQQETRDFGGRPQEIVFDAFTHLRRTMDATCVAPLLALIVPGCPQWLAREVATVVRLFGHAVVEPILTAYRDTVDPDCRAFLVEILTSTRVTDERIPGVCCEWLADEPAFAADMLTDYGDPETIGPLRARLALLGSGDRVTAIHFLVVANAIVALGGSLEPDEHEQRRAALETLIEPIRTRLAPLEPNEPVVAEQVICLTNAIEGLGGALSSDEWYQRHNAIATLEAARLAGVILAPNDDQ